ncbi:class A beta-lactamase-related serine hydrolase [Muriicola soli]|uniref:Class A beta-lactamase-related serine hydrolase n=2 Tax=Muriicola soli TaxID=2507538 RepID=A0A411ED92_9FLAO|nr:class A beta-lactamase-related serine hydrolase [Muriicola soli]
MYRIKITIGIAVVIFVLMSLTSGFDKPATNTTSFKPVASIEHKSTSIDPMLVMEYKWQKEELRKAVTEYFEKALASGRIIGAGVSIVMGDSTVISEGFGKRSIKTDKKVDAHTVFRLGSLSKGFTGLLAAHVIDEGKIEREAKVADYLPNFKLGDKQNTSRITFANLLSHSTGAPYHSYTNLVEAGLPLLKIAEQFRVVQPISAPGEIYSYQNALFALSGEIIYKATGEEIREALQARFFNPLQMCTVNMDYESLQDNINVAIPHSKWRRTWRAKKLNDHYYNAVAAGGINASSLDMAKWMKLLLGRHPEIMKKNAIEKAFKPVVEIKGRSKYYQRWPGHKSSHYGFGWRIHKYQENQGESEKTIWHHGGSVNGFRNEIAVYPDDDLGICVLLNSHSRIASTVIPDLHRIIAQVRQSTPSEMASNYFSE